MKILLKVIQSTYPGSKVSTNMLCTSSLSYAVGAFLRRESLERCCRSNFFCSPSVISDSSKGVVALRGWQTAALRDHYQVNKSAGYYDNLLFLSMTSDVVEHYRMKAKAMCYIAIWLNYDYNLLTDPMQPLFCMS